VSAPVLSTVERVEPSKGIARGSLSPQLYAGGFVYPVRCDNYLTGVRTFTRRLYGGFIRRSFAVRHGQAHNEGGRQRRMVIASPKAAAISKILSPAIYCVGRLAPSFMLGVFFPQPNNHLSLPVMSAVEGCEIRTIAAKSIDFEGNFVFNGS